jgi:hypothetical protein
MSVAQGLRLVLWSEQAQEGGCYRLAFAEYRPIRLNSAQVHHVI